MRDLTLRKRIATLVLMAFLSVMGTTVAAATVADSAEAQISYCGSRDHNEPCYR